MAVGATEKANVAYFKCEEKHERGPVSCGYDGYNSTIRNSDFIVLIRCPQIPINKKGYFYTSSQNLIFK